jgi:XTP/dITP diphosphohydrolase
LTKEENRETKFQLKGRVAFFATNNIHKFCEARSIMAQFDIALGMLRIKDAEIQSNDLVEIAQVSARTAFRRSGLPVIVEDAGLFIEVLNGFPGPYAAYIYKTIGNKGLLKLLNGEEDRKAVFKSAIAYCGSNTEEPRVFEGKVDGEITMDEYRAGESGFGFDPIFRPSGSMKTFAEMNLEEKNGFSHRAKAIFKFAEWYRKLR